MIYSATSRSHSGLRGTGRADSTHLYLLLKVFDFLSSLHLFSLLFLQVLSRDLKLILKSLQLLLQLLHMPLGIVEGLGSNLRGEGMRRWKRREQEEYNVEERRETRRREGEGRKWGGWRRGK